jgi:phenylpropionate dioxygenase-like ring-hydroxylating dioxygenase large terminal subunit
MLKNFWYACEFSSEVTHQPKQIVMLNQRFVLYRNSQGQVIALKDQCPHRGAALSLGWVEGDCIRCPYHGWKFQADGRCINIPANAPEVPIPKKAIATSYPVQESQGFIWLFYGDLPEAERHPLPTFPAYLSTKMHAAYNDEIECANYARLMEVNLDFAHVVAIHRKSFGQRVPMNKQIKYRVQEDAWSGVAQFSYDSLGDSKTVLNLLLGGRPEFTTTLTYYLPNITLAEIHVGGKGKNAIKIGILVAYLPIDEKTSRSKRVFYRNFLTLPWLDGWARKLDYAMGHEDTVVVETLAEQPMPRISEELHVAADALALSFRKQQQKYLAKGWGLESSRHPLTSATEDATQPVTSLVN